MGFLKNFFTNVFQEEETAKAKRVGSVNTSSFEQLSEDELESHLGVQRYGKFRLTEAVRPSYDLQVIPEQGYRHDIYHDEEAKSNVPVIMASASAEILFELFMELIDPLGSELDVVLETSHSRESGGHTDLYREHIDTPVLKSTLWGFEDLLTNDGCTGIAVLNPQTPQEVQFDEHKLLIVYGKPLGEFERIFESYGVSRQDEIKFITEAEHVHSSSDTYHQQFDEMKVDLGMDGIFG